MALIHANLLKIEKSRIVFVPTLTLTPTLLITKSSNSRNYHPVTGKVIETSMQHQYELMSCQYLKYLYYKHYLYVTCLTQHRAYEYKP